MLGSTGVTVQPASRASCIAREPTAPLAPVTSTCSPACSFATSCSATHADVVGEKNAAPSVIGNASGKRPRASSGASISSLQVPSNSVPSPLPRSHTRCPTSWRSLATTMPAASTPGV
jgi:hypothetical protein